MSTLDDLNAGPGGMAGFVSALTRRMRPVSRRDVLVGATVAATALATKPKEYALTPVAAYATICGPGNTASQRLDGVLLDGQQGRQHLPAGQLRRGLVEGRRLVVVRRRLPLHRRLQRQLLEVHDRVQRRHVRLQVLELLVRHRVDGDLRPAPGLLQRLPLRPVQHPDQVQRWGALPRRELRGRRTSATNCTTTSLSDNRTSEHSAPSLPRLGARSPQKYHAMGEQASFLKASTGPVSACRRRHAASTSASRAGVIYCTSKTGAVAVTDFIRHDLHRPTAVHAAPGSATRPPTSRTPAVNGGWIQTFERGAITDSASTRPSSSGAPAGPIWKANGREGGDLGYPIDRAAQPAPRTGLDPALPAGRHRRLPRPPRPRSVAGSSDWTVWSRLVARPRPARLPAPVRSRPCPTAPGSSCSRTARSAAGPATHRSSSPARCTPRGSTPGASPACSGYPTGPSHTGPRGLHAVLPGGELWALGAGSPPRRVYGAVLTEWKAARGSHRQLRLPGHRHDPGRRRPAHLHLRGRHHHGLTARRFSPIGTMLTPGSANIVPTGWITVAAPRGCRRAAAGSPAPRRAVPAAAPRPVVTCPSPGLRRRR